MFDAKIISVPLVDFNTLLSVAKQALEYNPAEAVDNCGRKVSASEKLISIIAAFLDADADPGLNPKLLGFADATVMVGLPIYDFTDFITPLSGMEFAFRELGEIQFGFVKGNLAQWRDSIAAGTNALNTAVQGYFCILHQRIESCGLSLWRDYRPVKTREHYRLEYKPQ